VALLAAGCSRAASPTSGTGATGGSSTATAGQGTGGTFGTLSSVCHPGSASGAPDQGITSGQVRVGVFTDASFTKDNTYPVTAKVFAD
jgi:hypothetical protein